MDALSAHNLHWADAPPKPELRRGEVHLWQVPLLVSLSMLRTHKHVLSPDERQQAARFHFDRDRRRYLAAHISLRFILERYTGIEVAQLQYRRAAHGKPALHETQNVQDFRFNLSHSHELGLVAVTVGREVGVDVEYVRPISDLEGLAATAFTPGERAQFDSLPAEQKLRAFYVGWVQKEAYLKALGSGLERLDLPFDVSLTEPAGPAGGSGNPAGAVGWEIRTLIPQSGYMGAVCLEASITALAAFRMPG